MKKNLLLILAFTTTFFTYSQTDKLFWASTTKKEGSIVSENKKQINSPRLFELDVSKLKQALLNVPDRINSHFSKSNTIISFPNTNGELENYSVYAFSNMDPALAAKYPEIKSYIGQSIENPSSTIYFSISPLGIETMVIHADRSAEFIEPYTTDQSAYVVYKKSDKIASLNKFECRVIENIKTDLNSQLAARPNADDGTLRTFRLAMSVTGEYTTYFGGTKALALAAINK